MAGSCRYSTSGGRDSDGCHRRTDDGGAVVRHRTETGRRLGFALALVALASFLVAPSSPSRKEVLERSLAQVDQALETNPGGVSEAALNSCRAMRKTATLLYRMRRYVRAFQRLKSCRDLLRIDWYRSGDARPSRVSWLA